MSRERSKSKKAKSPGVTVLGWQLADAREHEAIHRQAHPEASPLANVPPYGPEDYDLFRFRASATDESIDALLESCMALDISDITDIRDALTMDDQYELYTYCRRAFLRSLRAGTPDHAVLAVQGLALMDKDRMDWRDTSTVASLLLYAIKSTGGDRRRAFDEAAGRTSPEMSKWLQEFPLRKLGSIETETGYRRYESDDGVVLTSDDFKPYAPTIDLVQIASAVIDVFEAGGWKIVEVKTGAEKPPIWFKRATAKQVAKAMDNLKGGVVLRATETPSRSGSDQMMLVLVAEARSAAEASTLSAAIGSDGKMPFAAMGISFGPLCITVIERSVMKGTPDAETDDSLERFRSPLEAVLEASNAHF